MRATYTQEVQQLTRSRQNVRNMTVSGHVDHGKDSAGKVCVMDCGKQEQERGITMKSTGISLILPHPMDGSEFLINLVDSPGHIHFSAEVTAALRISDGTLVVVDCIEGVCVQTETVLRQALTERVQPVLHLNKLDRGIDLQLTEEALYQRLNETIQGVNSVIASFYSHHPSSPAQANLMDPITGNVTFGSGKLGWGFSLPQLARFYSKECNIPSEKLLPKLWGDHFYNVTTRKFTSSPYAKDGQKVVRVACHFVLSPILKIYSACVESDQQTLSSLLTKIGVSLNDTERSMKGLELAARVLRKWLPLPDALLGAIIDHLPSPVQAQPYRVSALYSGDPSDSCYQAIEKCDPDGPLVMFISKLVPVTNTKHFCAFGRVFSGTLTPQQPLYAINSVVSDNDEETKRVVSTKASGLVLMMGKFTVNIDCMPCGGVVSVIGVENVLNKCGTLSSTPTASPIRSMQFSVSPIVQQSIIPSNPALRGKFSSALHCLSQTDQCLQVKALDTGEFIVSGAGELHLEVVMKDLEELVGSSAAFTIGPPTVNYCESVRSRSAMVFKAKTQNNLNRLFFTAEELDSSFIEYFNGKSEMKDPASKLISDLAWDPTLAKKVWKICGTNCLVNSTHSVDHLMEIKDAVISAFEELVREGGAFAGEPLRGVRFNLIDAKIHSDRKHRGGQQIKPAASRAMKAAQLSSSPCLLEPIYLCEINLVNSESHDDISRVKKLLKKLRGNVVQIEDVESSLVLSAHLPIATSFGFEGVLRKETSGRAFPQLRFDHWSDLDQDLASKVVVDIRRKKGMQFQNESDLGCVAEYPNVITETTPNIVPKLAAQPSVPVEKPEISMDVPVDVQIEATPEPEVETDVIVPEEKENAVVDTTCEEVVVKGRVRCGICKMRGHSTSQHR